MAAKQLQHGPVEYGTLPSRAEAGTQDSHSSTQGTSVILVHLALFYVFASFGGGAAVSKLGIHAGSPVVFELFRELLSAPLLTLAAYACRAPLVPDRRDMSLLFRTGFCLFCNQCLYFIGLKLADPITGSAWQSSIPVFTASFAIALGYERITLLKTVGILMATSAAVFMTLSNSNGEVYVSHSSRYFGHLCFLICGLGTSAYIVLSKKLVAKYEAISVSAWCFTVSCVLLVGVCVIINTCKPLTIFICADKDAQVALGCTQNPWALSSSSTAPLLYEVLNNTLISWFLMSWANKYAKATVVSIYTVVQPISTVVISAWAIFVKGREWAIAYGFRMPGLDDAVAILVIFVSLVAMFSSESTLQSNADPSNTAPKQVNDNA